jgi:tight adherence protein B
VVRLAAAVLWGTAIVIGSIRWTHIRPRRVGETAGARRVWRRLPVPRRRPRAPRRRPGAAAGARAVAAWCDDLARQVRSGVVLTHALATEEPAATWLRDRTADIRRRLERGSGVADAIDQHDDRPGEPLQLALEVIAIAAEVGGPAAAPLERTAAVLRQRAADLDERTVQAAQARLSAHVMTCLPLAILAVLVVTDDDVVAALGTPVGAACLVCGLLANQLGWWWMRRIVLVSP